MTLYIGIDPGANGAVAILNDNAECIELFDMPKTDTDYYNKILEWSSNCTVDTHVMVENVHALPFESAVASFSFGKNCGKASLLAMSMAKGNKPHDVSPQRWKSYYTLKRYNGETKFEYKKRSIEKAKELFPDLKQRLLKSKDGRAEALLIAMYCHYRHHG